MICQHIYTVALALVTASRIQNRDCALHYHLPSPRACRLVELTLPAPHDSQSLVLRHGTYISPSGIPDSAYNSPAHLAVGALIELADEGFVRAKAERGSRWVVDVDTVAIDGLRPGATAGPVRAGAIVGADEPDLDALRRGEGEEGKGEQREEGERIHDCGVHCAWV